MDKRRMRRGKIRKEEKKKRNVEVVVERNKRNFVLVLISRTIEIEEGNNRSVEN